VADEERTFGIRNDTFAVVEALARFGYQTWFRLGDRDLATCLHRTNLLRQGRRLSEATADIARAFGLRCALLPATDDPLRTKLETEDGLLDFQDYFVRLAAQVPVRRVVYVGAEEAKPAPGVLEAIARSQAIIVAPSNPILSIGPVLAVPGVREALRQATVPVAAISPIVGGAALKGPADRLMRHLGLEPSPVTVARLYADFLRIMVIDQADAHLAPQVAALGLEVMVTDTIMTDVSKKEALARSVLAALGVRR
jgi:LPPG:FO 2-phospho-L-lactate transferase